ncbi:MAG: CpsD/CapB family tyrosine-protein kinase [Bryobacteraceae bacterium]|nr:CpsD/CapB family tyrosine-protein kinase [Bryobacteraceae bacterium]
MSRVHDALRKAEQAAPSADAKPDPPASSGLIAAATALADRAPLPTLLDSVEQVAFNPAPEAHLIVMNSEGQTDAPSEEFRTLRTRMNHLQSLQPIRTVLVTSASPGEGKSFTSTNLALAEAQLAENPTLLADFDFRRPVVHTYFDLNRTPGVTDYLQGKAELKDIIKKIAGMNLYVIPAGESVINPLELLNLATCKQLLDELSRVFKWVIIDTPPLLLAADANLLGTYCHGILLVVRVGSTTIDSVSQAMQSLCENNVLGVVANCARRDELYGRYSYYHSYYYQTASGDERDDDQS